MAKNYKLKINDEVLKKNVSDALKSTEGLKELKKEARVIFSRVNKKLDRLKASNTVSPAYEGIIERHGTNFHFTYGGTNEESLQSLINEALIFESRQTSTIRGAKRFTNDLKDLIRGHDVNDEKYINSVFDTMHGVAERIPIELQKNMIGTDIILNTVIDRYVEDEISELSDADRDDLIDAIVDRLTKSAKKQLVQKTPKIVDSFRLK